MNLNVTITGKGFRRGVVARFLVTSTTNTGGVTVNSTTFVGGTQAVANIDVAVDAVISKFDIEMLNSDGRTGKGVELFAVTSPVASQSANPLARADFSDLATDRVRSDGVVLPALCLGYDYADAQDPCRQATKW